MHSPSGGLHSLSASSYFCYYHYCYYYYFVLLSFLTFLFGMRFTKHVSYWWAYVCSTSVGLNVFPFFFFFIVINLVS